MNKKDRPDFFFNWSINGRPFKLSSFERYLSQIVNWWAAQRDQGFGILIVRGRNRLFSHSRSELFSGSDYKAFTPAFSSNAGLLLTPQKFLILFYALHLKTEVEHCVAQQNVSAVYLKRLTLCMREELSSPFTGDCLSTKKFEEKKYDRYVNYVLQNGFYESRK